MPATKASAAAFICRRAAGEPAPLLANPMTFRPMTGNTQGIRFRISPPSRPSPSARRSGESGTASVTVSAAPIGAAPGFAPGFAIDVDVDVDDGALPEAPGCRPAAARRPPGLATVGAVVPVAVVPN